MLNTILQFGNIEVHQQSSFRTGQLHVGQSPSLVDAFDLFDTLQFDDLFENTAEARYTRTLRFSTVADLISEVVFDS